MKNQNVKGIIALVLVTALSFGVIIGTKTLTTGDGGAAGGSSSAAARELDVSGADSIEKAVQLEDGSYVVSVVTKGYHGDIRMDVTFDETKTQVVNLAITDESETDGVGSKITEADFLSQFANVAAPVYLPGMSVESAGADGSGQGEAQTEAAPQPVEDPVQGAALQDGTYEAQGTPDENGYTEQMTMTVENGAITAVTWDSVAEDGTSKSHLSEIGEYVMTEDGLTWKEQSEALAQTLIENQTLSAFTMDSQGKTDAVSGVSISIGGFISLAEQCMEEAAGLTREAPVLQDGTYEAQGTPDENGYTEQMTMTVENGAITAVTWDSVAEDGTSKSHLSEIGEYVMTEDGPTWKEQSEALAQALIENQSLDILTMDDQGKTDAVSGVSISIGGFVSLAEQCMAQAAGENQAPVLQDGTYEAQGTPDENGYTEQMTMTVENGAITAVTWDSVAEDGTSKSHLSEIGEYVMTEDGLTWKEQSEALAQALIENQSLDVLTMDDQGKTDAVSGVSISIGGFVSLAEQCMAQAAGEELPEETTAAAETEAAQTEAAQTESGNAGSGQAGTQIDAISGATVSSTAVVTGVNAAYQFLQTAE